MSSGQKVIKYLAIGFAACLTISILCGVLNVLVSIFGAFVPREHSNNVSDKEIETAADSSTIYQDVENLKIDSSIYEVKIKQDSSIEGVKIVLHHVSSQYNVTYNESTKTLETEEDNWISGLFGKKRSQSGGNITIYVSNKLELKNVEINMGVGNVELSDIFMNALDVENGVGEFKCDNITAESASIQGGVGNVECKDVNFNGLSVEGGVGDIDINGTLTGKTDLSAGMGNVDLNLKGEKDDYNYKIDTGLGGIYIDGEKYGDCNLNNNSQTNLVSIEGGVGTIHVDFN